MERSKSEVTYTKRIQPDNLSGSKSTYFRNLPKVSFGEVNFTENLRFSDLDEPVNIKKTQSNTCTGPELHCNADNRDKCIPS